MPTTHKENYNFVWMAGNVVIHMIEQNNDTYNYPQYLSVGGYRASSGLVISRTYLKNKYAMMRLVVVGGGVVCGVFV